MVKDIKESCELSKSLEVNFAQQICSQYDSQAYNFLAEINSNRDHVMKIIETPKSNYRTKRGLINIVGKIANILFGVCDSTDAEYFYDKIRELEFSKLRIIQLADTQTQIMQSIISNVNSSLLEMEENQTKLANKFNYLLQEAQVEKLEIGILNFKAALEERVSLLTIILTQYAFETENLVSIINMALQGLVHSSILDANTFKNQIKDIKSQLPVGEGIPINIENSSLSELFRLITTNVIFVENVLIFIMEIPLIISYEFLLYKIIPLPVNVNNNSYVLIAPSSDYIAVDKSKMYYLELSEIQLSKCKPITNMLICPYDQQLRHLDKSCELTLFRRQSILPESCVLKNINFKFNIWHRLDNTNSWIYVTTGDNIIVKCKNSTEVISLNIDGIGILELSSECEANTDDGTILITKKRITTKIFKDFIPQLNVSMDKLTQLNVRDIISNKSMIEDTRDSKIKYNLHKLLEYSNSLKYLKDNLTENHNTNMKNDYVFIFIIVSISIGLLILLTLLYSKLNNSRNRTTKCIKEETISEVCEELKLNLNKNASSESTPGKSLPRII